MTDRQTTDGRTTTTYRWIFEFCETQRSGIFYFAFTVGSIMTAYYSHRFVLSFVLWFPGCGEVCLVAYMCGHVPWFVERLLVWTRRVNDDVVQQAGARRAAWLSWRHRASVVARLGLACSASGPARPQRKNTIESALCALSAALSEAGCFRFWFSNFLVVFIKLDDRRSLAAEWEAGFPAHKNYRCRRRRIKLWARSS